MKPMTGCTAMKGQKLILVLSPDGSLVFLHVYVKQTEYLAQIGTGVLRPRNVMHQFPASLRWKRFLHVYQCFPEGFRCTC